MVITSVSLNDVIILFFSSPCALRVNLQAIGLTYPVTITGVLLSFEWACLVGLNQARDVIKTFL